VRTAEKAIITVVPAGTIRAHQAWRASCSSCDWTFRGRNELAVEDLGIIHSQVHTPEVEAAWEAAQTMGGDPALYRRDRRGAPMKRSRYRQERHMGWLVRDGVAHATVPGRSRGF